MEDDDDLPSDEQDGDYRIFPQIMPGDYDM